MITLYITAVTTYAIKLPTGENEGLVGVELRVADEGQRRVGRRRAVGGGVFGQVGADVLVDDAPCAAAPTALFSIRQLICATFHFVTCNGQGPVIICSKIKGQWKEYSVPENGMEYDLPGFCPPPMCGGSLGRW